jgi:hypothetical protein
MDVHLLSLFPLKKDKKEERTLDNIKGNILKITAVGDGDIAESIIIENITIGKVLEKLRSANGKNLQNAIDLVISKL